MPKTIHAIYYRGLLTLGLLLCSSFALSAQLTVELEGEDPICFGLASGSITSTVSGGTIPYTYNWSTGDETAFLTNLTAGLYLVTVTDADGETGTSSITLTEPSLVTIDLTSDQNCDNPFTLTADADGGVGNYNYNWSTGESTVSIVVNDDLQYCVTVVDENGCGTFECISVVANPPDVEVAGVDITCYGDADGSLTATGSAGTPPYSYEWNTGDIGATITNLGPGTYTVTLTDANECTATATGTVVEPPELTTTTQSLHDVCPGGATGSVMVIPEGGTPPYSYLWSTGAMTQGEATLPAGVYTVTVTDANGCTAVDDVEVLELDGPEVMIEGDLIICGAGNTTDLTATATGGTGNYQFEWNTGALVPTITVGPGTYSVTVTDGNDCTDDAVATVTIVDVAIELTGTDVSCNGGEDGTATVTVTGGDMPYTYDWDDLPGTDNPSDRTGLAPGTYTVEVTEANGCKAMGTITIGQPPILDVIGEVTNILCNGDETGAINIAAVGGTAPYTYDWSDLAGNDNPDDRTGLAAGTYTVTVTDANGCTTSESFTINEPPALQLNADPTDVLCNGDETGSIDVTVSGGTPAYTYDWADLAGSDNPSDRSGLSAGTYSLTVTDANGCTASTTATVNEPPALTISADPTDILCNGDETGSIDVTVGGGTAPYTYDWADLAGNNNGADRTGLAAGTYSVTATDANGCMISTTATINGPPALTINADETDILCNGDETGAIDLTVTGGVQPYTYNWADLAGSDNPADRNDLGAGTYSVTATDANGCTISTTVTVSEPPALMISADPADVLCNGDETGSIDLTVSGGTPAYTYDWADLAGTDDPADRTGLAAGTYSVTATDANGCMISTTATINEPAALTISADPTNVLCNGDETGAIDLTVGGGNSPYTYDWADLAGTNDPGDRSGLGAGTYSVTATDANGCTISTTVTINEPPALEINADETNVLCNGDETGAIDLTVTGGVQPYTYNWSDLAGDDNPGDRTGLGAGTYNVTATDANGCTISTTVTISEPPALNISANATDVLCAGDETGSIDLTVSGGTPAYTYDWADLAGTDDPADRTGLGIGTYSVTATDVNGCTISTTATVEAPNPLTISADETNILCNGDETGAIDLTVGGGTAPYTYNWADLAGNDNPGDRTGLAAGAYTVTVIDANDCSVSTTVSITEPPALEINADETDVLCNGNETGAIDLTVTGGVQPYTYDWADLAGNDNPADRSGLGAGTYSVTATDANGCTISTMVTITEPTALTISADPSDVLCNGDETGAINLTVGGGTPAYTYDWADLAGTDDPADRTGLAAGTYSVTATDANGCTISTTATVNEPAALSINADPTNVLCNGDETGAIDLTVGGGNSPYTYDWADLAGSNDPGDRSGLSAGTYSVTATDANGCTISITVTISEPPALAIDADPSSVSCNGDEDGSIDLTVTGGVQPYTYDWADLAGTDDPADRSGLTAGTYSVTATDANGCTISTTTTVTERAQLNCEVVVLQEPTSGNNGSLQVNASGGTPGYTYLWSNGETTQVIDGLAPGTYDVTVTDANGCTTTCSATLAAFAGIGDYVWEDTNLNGVQDEGEPAVAGVTVYLKDENGMIIDTTMTDANGFYSFMGLTPGTYAIQFVIPDGFDYTASNIGADDALDSDIIPGMMGMTGFYDLDPGEFDMTVDAGIIVPPNGVIADPCLCLNNATNDNNGQFSEEIRIESYPGLTWTIIDRMNMFVDDDTNNPPNAPVEIPIGTVIDEVSPGVYELHFRLVDELMYSVQIQAGQQVLTITNTCFYPDIIFGTPLPTEICRFDPAFPLEASSTIPGDLIYTINGVEVQVLDPGSLPAGTYNLVITLDPLDEEECLALLNVEFLIVGDCPAKIGDFVWEDLDGDGVQDPGEPGIEGVKVTINSQDGLFMDMQFTDENGMYMFMVDPGTYKITFEQPEDMIPSPQNQGGDDALDSDMDPTMLMTGFYTLGPDEYNMTVDGGFYNPCVLNISNPGMIGFDQEVCGPGNVPNTLVETAPAGGGVGQIEYLWMYNTVDPGQNINFWHPIPNSNSLNYSPGALQETTYFTRCVRRNNCPYIESNIIVVTVGDDAVAIIDGPELGCEGETLTFNALGTGPGAVINWSFSGDAMTSGTSGQSVTATWGSFGVHSVTLSVTENGCTSTTTRTISIVTNPVYCGGNLNATGTVNSMASRNISIDWMMPNDGYPLIYVVERSQNGEDFEAAGTVEEADLVIDETMLYSFQEVAPVAGRNYYRVRAFDQWGESLVSNIVQLQLNEDQGQLGRIFPNPTTNGMIHVEMMELQQAEDLVVQLVSATGAVISAQTLPGNTDIVDLPLHKQATGVYFVRLIRGEQVETHRVVVNN